MDKNIKNEVRRDYYVDVKGTGVISVIIFGFITFTLMMILSHFM